VCEIGKDALMQTIKTGIVVALLLTVCYGAYVAMNSPDVQVPEDLKQWADQNGHDVEPSLEVPQIAQNTPLPPGTNSAGQSELTNPRFPSVDFPAVDLPGASPSNFQAPAANNNLTLPAMSSSLSATPSLPLTSAESNTSGFQPGTLASFPTNSGNPTGPANNLSADGNNLTKVLEPFSGSTEGPSIQFDPGNIASNSLNSASAYQGGLADDLITAGSEFSAAPLLNPTNTADAVNAAGTPPSVQSEAASNQPKQPTQTFAVAKNQALQLAAQAKLGEALELMTQYYESPELGYEEHTDLVDMLDALSREVIYSNRHLLSPAHTVSAQDTLQSLSNQLKINPELLAAINQMGNSQALIANSKMKVVEGPFHAQISLSRGELTLFLRKMYAGRFPVSISQKNMPPAGRYEIVDRRQDRLFYGANVRIPAGDPSNPYGGYWLSLGGDYAIHGSPEQVTTDLEGAGSISLAPLDAADVYRILSKGSAVEIRN
jgi:hypothetical protein